MQQPQKPSRDFSLKAIIPYLGGRGGGMTADLLTNTYEYELVDHVQYLYVRVVKAKDLPSKDVTGSCDPYVELKVGNLKGTTRHFEKNTNPEWNQVFVFSKERIQSSILEVLVKDKDLLNDDFIGFVTFNLNEVPQRVPPDSPLAPEWYRLEDHRGSWIKGELMLAVWMGTQADEEFSGAWDPDAAMVCGDGHANIRSKVYHSPKLWYLRVNVIEAQELQPSDITRIPEVFVKAILGNQALSTNISQTKHINPFWNEDLMFVAAEPFDENLILIVEDRLGPNKDEVIGRCVLPLQGVQRRLDNTALDARWYNLEKHVDVEGNTKEKKETKFASRICLRICLEGGYHVMDESTYYSSDLRPTVKQLWKPSIGILKLGIMNAKGLLPMKIRDGRESTDAYCVAKYGPKWVKTRTIIDSLTPKWNEEYAWEVFDPCTVITIGVFDNCHLQEADKAEGAKDLSIGKVRIRLSTLESCRAYICSYPLLVLHPSGVKKMGEVQLAVKFTFFSLSNTMNTYSQPLWPKLHYTHPLPPDESDHLRHQVTGIVSMRLSRAEPPLRKEVVEYMLDVDPKMWSIRRTKANILRIMGALSGLVAVFKWFDQIRNWKSPPITILVHILFVMLVLLPDLIPPAIFFNFFLIGVRCYRRRPRNPPHLDVQMSLANNVHPSDLNEEFDILPTSEWPEIVRMRYARLRRLAWRIQTVIGDLAIMAERLQSLLSWRDPRATALFVIFCLIASIILYAAPFQVVVLLAGFYVLRHPRYRHKLPSAPLNFFKRLPARTESIL